MTDQINKPAHYFNNRRIQPLEVIEDWSLCHNLACVIKYIARYGLKNNHPTLDLEKAVFYLERKIELIRAGSENREPCKPEDTLKLRVTKLNYSTDGHAPTEALKSDNIKKEAEKSVWPCIDCGHELGDKTICPNCGKNYKT